MKTISLISSSCIYELKYQATSQFTINFALINKYNTKFDIPPGSQTRCKEMIGKSCVQTKSNRFLVICSHRLTDEEVQTLLGKIRTFEHQVGVIFQTRAYRVKDKPDTLMFHISRRWHYNTALHAIYTTRLRHELFKMKDGNLTADNYHMGQSKWIFDTIKDIGISILGCRQHTKYDWGVEGLMFRLKNQCYWDKENDYQRGEVDKPIEHPDCYKEIRELYNLEKETS